MLAPLLVVVGAVLFSLQGCDSPAWTYAHHGTDWKAKYPYCAGTISSERRNNEWQSPIDIPANITAYGKTPVFQKIQGRNCNPRRTTNGHSWQLDFEGECDYTFSVALDKRTYQLKQYHFHSGSEHTHSGKRYDMEVHLVHEDVQTADTTNNLVVGVLLQVVGDANKADIKAASLDALPIDPYSTFVQAAAAGDDAAGTFSSYTGSMTTPDCLSDVQWIVFEDPVSITEGMLQRFIADVGPNRSDGVASQAAPCDLPGHTYCTYRAEQPLNERIIKKGRYQNSVQSLAGEPEFLKIIM